MPESTTGALEPVSWDARLVRAPGAGYTEVDGYAIVVSPDTGEVQPLTPVWAGLWARLDGGPVAETLQVDPESLPQVDARNLLEVLRRLKARGLVVDVERDADPGPEHPLEVPVGSGPFEVVLRGAVQAEDGQRTLHIDRTLNSSVKVRVSERDGEVVAWIRRRFRRRVIDTIEVVTDDLEFTDAGALRALAVIVAAVVDRDVLRCPGVADLLAGLAERAIAPASPHR